MTKLSMRPVGWGVLIALLVLAIGLSACSDGTLDEQSQAVVAGGGDVPEVRVVALNPSSAGTLKNIDVDIAPAEGGYDISIRAGQDLSDLNELFLNIKYDPSLNHSLGLDTVADDSSSIIGLAVEPVPGSIDMAIVGVEDHGINNGNTGRLDDPTVPKDDPGTDPIDDGGDDIGPPPGPTPFSSITPGDTLMTFKLVKGAASKGASEAAASNRHRARNVELQQNGDGDWVLSWDYTNPGDNNQDGLVGAIDLTGIGQNWNRQVSDTFDDPLRHIDSNGDGLINVNDITAIGQNYSAEIFSYRIQMWDDETQEFFVVGTLDLDQGQVKPNETYRFNYTFRDSQYVPQAWFRVQSLDRDLEFGAPSEAISELGRRVDPVDVQSGKQVMVTVNVVDLPNPIAHMNGARVIYPSSFSYVRGSANAGSSGGPASHPDGIWASFASGLLFPDDFFFQETDLGNGKTAIDFNVTTVVRNLDGAPVGYGDLINFKLESDGTEALTLEFQDVSDDGIKRTYYTDDKTVEHFFGNALGFKIQ